MELDLFLAPDPQTLTILPPYEGEPRRAQLFYLPPYSPDMNPIEMAFAKLKALLRKAAERGIAVPDDLSVAGFDDTPTATSTRPALTTVHQPHIEKGRTAARLLLDGAPATVVELPTELVVRTSTGPAD